MKLRSVCLAAVLALAATSLGAAEQSDGADIGGGRAVAVSVALGGHSGGAPLQLAGAEIGSGMRYALLENVGNGVALAGNETGHGNPLFSAEGAEAGGGRPA